MSELITNTRQENLRWHLLNTVSAASLLLAVSAPSTVMAEDMDRPTVWIELGGQFEIGQGNEDRYAAPFIIRNLGRHLDSPLNAQQPPHSDFAGEGKISFEPAGTDWIFSAAVRYGRSNGKKDMFQQTQAQYTHLKTALNGILPGKYGYATVTSPRFSNSQTKYSSAHAIIDFMAGRDVGLGVFGRFASSTFSAGVRYAQFGTKSDIVFHSLPSRHYPNYHSNKGVHSTYYAHAEAERTFHGVGPSISWDASAAVLGKHEEGEVTLDWGINAAALFGRQRVTSSHETKGFYITGSIARVKSQYDHITPVVRSHSVVVPNLGGFAGISVKYPNAKFSVGYRADFFFNAMDEGTDTRNSGTRGFLGPFATVSIGLGG